MFASYLRVLGLTLMICDISEACSTDWYGPNSGYYYRYHTDKKNFDDAIKACSDDNGGHLVSIHSEAEWLLVQTRVCDGSDEVWLGMVIEKAGDVNSAKWLDQTPVDFKPSNFEVGGNRDGQGVRMERSSEQWQWNDLKRRQLKKFMCKRVPRPTTTMMVDKTTTPTKVNTVAVNPPATPAVNPGPSVPAVTTTTTTTTTQPATTTAPKVHTPRTDVHAGYTRSPTPCQSEDWAYSNQTGHCYLFFLDTVTQDEAIKACKAKHSELLSIENQDEQNFVDTVLRFDFYDQWTLGRKDEFGNFTYNGTEITYENWLADNLLTKVQEGEEVCIALVKIYYRGFYLLKWKWDTKPCGEKKSFACQHIANRCPPLPLVDFVEPHPPKPFIELTIKYTCQPGYKMPNYTQRYQEWQREEPVGDVEANVTEAWQASKPNITTMPSMKYECLFPGKWSDGSLAPCEPKCCKEPPEVKHAERNSSDREFPAWIEYKCTHGYHYAHDNTSAKVAWCSPDEEWTDVPPNCSPVECGEFRPVGNATVSSAYKNLYRDTVVWTCIPGFMFPDRSVSQWVGCRENYVNWQIGRWNLSKLPDCIPLECLEPPNPANTSRSSNATAYRSIVSYRCVSDEFEFPSGDEELNTQCNMEALWRPSVPNCRKKPPKLKMKGKKYEPPPMESPEAKAVGTVAVAIMVVLLVLTVLIDIGSFYQGYRYLRYNLRTFSQYYGFVDEVRPASPPVPSQPSGPIRYIPHTSVHPLTTPAPSEFDSSFE